MKKIMVLLGWGLIWIFPAGANLNVDFNADEILAPTTVQTPLNFRDFKESFDRGDGSFTYEDSNTTVVYENFEDYLSDNKLPLLYKNTETGQETLILSQACVSCWYVPWCCFRNSDESCGYTCRRRICGCK